MPGGPILPPDSNVGPYWNIQGVCNLVRVILNDTQNNGAGRIFVDTAPFVLPILNASIGELQRRLQNKSVTTKISDAFLFGIPPINSNLGVGAPNTASYQQLSYTGFFDGGATTPNPFLPPDLIVPITVKARLSGSGLQFVELPIAQEGLPSILQGVSLGQWEWRGDSIWWNGSTQVQDVEIRYQQAPAYFPFTISPDAFPTTLIPIADGGQALAYLMASVFVGARIPPGGANPIKAMADSIIQDLSNRYVRSSQNRVYERNGFGDEGSGFLGGGW